MFTGSLLRVVMSKFEYVDQGSTHKPPTLAQLCPFISKFTLKISSNVARVGLYTSIEHRSVVPEGIPVICWERYSCGEKVVDNCKKGVPSSAGIFPVVTTATLVSPPPFPIETEKGTSVPVLKSPFSKRFGLQANALELAAAEEDMTELSNLVEVLDGITLEDTSEVDGMTELFDKLEVNDEIAPEDTSEDDGTAELSKKPEVLDVIALEDKSEDDSMTELSGTLEVVDEVALEETADPGSTSPQGGCWSTELGLYRIEN
jgi:hypothetical protein